MDSNRIIKYFRKKAEALGIYKKREADVLDEIVSLHGLGDHKPMLGVPHTSQESAYLVAVIKRLGQVLDVTHDAARTTQMVSLVALLISITALFSSCGTPDSVSKLERENIELQKQQIELIKKLSAELASAKAATPNIKSSKTIPTKQ